MLTFSLFDAFCTAATEVKQIKVVRTNKEHQLHLIYYGFFHNMIKLE